MSAKSLLTVQQELRKAKAELQRQRIKLPDGELIAPFSGTVLEIFARPGERPSTDGVLSIGRSDQMEAVLEVYESDIGRVRIGQRVVLQSENGGFDGELQGRVQRINPLIQQRDVLSTDPTADTDARVVEVHVVLDPADARRVRQLTGLETDRSAAAMIRALWRQRGVPLAWLLLSRQPVRLLIALAGISFAGILMFMQLGFRDGLFDASVTIHRLFDADLVLMSPRSMSSISMAGFPERRLIQTMAEPEVESVSPVHWNFVLWRNPETRSTARSWPWDLSPMTPCSATRWWPTKPTACGRKVGCCLIRAQDLNLAPLLSASTPVKWSKVRWQASGYAFRVWWNSAPHLARTAT